MLKGHDLLKLLAALPAGARTDIKVVSPPCRLEFPPVGNPELSACTIRIDRAIFVMKVMHEACKKAIGADA
jgi:hypothetical protein